MSTAEFLALDSSIKAKNRRGKLDQPKTGTDDEGKLHRAILDECARRGWIAFHGSMAHKTFRVEGEPDFIVLGSLTETWADGSGPSQSPRCWLIECKTRTGKLSTAQQAIHAWAAKLGHTVHVVRSFEEFLEIVR
jgi:hypothetical protein